LISFTKRLTGATLTVLGLVFGFTAGGSVPPAFAGELDYGKVGTPVHLTVGYQPYDTISYSAAVIRALDLWKKNLPPGSDVEFQVGLQGSIIVNQMLAGKQQIGYLGDMPAVVATTKTNVTKINLVANTGISPGQRCNLIMVRADAPHFKSPEEAIKWLDGKKIATPKGSCADRFLGDVLEKTKIKPSAILNQSLEVLSTNLRAKKLDAAVLWEPTASRISDVAGEGIARYAVTGTAFGISDSGYIAMRDDLMKQRPDVVEGWLKTELEAQRFVLDPKNWVKVAEIVKAQTTGISVRMAWFSEYGKIPAYAGGSALRDEKAFVFEDRIHQQLIGIYHFLYENKVISINEPPAGALDDSIARKVAKDAGAQLPLGSIQAQDISHAPK
jgi:sulfonate transport system substrate-binding protein